MAVYSLVNGCRSVAEANPWPCLGERTWWVSRVFIHRTMRGQGLGSLMVGHLVKEIFQKGAKAIVVAPGGYNSNYNRQVNFYVKNGFKPTTDVGLYRLERS